MTIFVDPWAASYNTAYLVAPDDSAGADTELVEDGTDLKMRTPACDEAELAVPLAFVDGVRRGDATLYQEDPATSDPVRGIAGSHACGAVLVEPGAQPVFGPTRVTRLAIWGSGRSGSLPDVAGGWSWRVLSVPGTDPGDPLAGLQARMRAAEQDLAKELFAAGYLTVLDGPLSRLHSLGDAHLVGYVKTHSKVLLSPDKHRLVPGLAGGQRTSLFRIGDERYSCYLRLVERSASAPPWSGIVRIEMPADAGQSVASGLADRLSVLLPRFAGVPHRDPRAPQNLQPVGALETHLRHLLGPPGLASRAVREAVAELIAAVVP